MRALLSILSPWRERRYRAVLAAADRSKAIYEQAKATRREARLSFLLDQHNAACAEFDRLLADFERRYHGKEVSA